MLALEFHNDGLKGTQSGDGTAMPIVDARLEGNNISRVNHTPRPMKLKCEFKGVIDGAQITGKVKAGFMGSYPFTAVKA